MPKLIPLFLFLAACSTSTHSEPAEATPRAEVAPAIPAPREPVPAPSAPRAPEPREPSANSVAPIVPPTPPVAEPDAQALATTSGLRARRTVISSGMVGREPTDSLTEVSPGVDTRLYAFVELDNPNRTDTKIVSYWLRPDGTKHSPVELSVGPQRSWRTWAYTTHHVGIPGTWTAVFETLDGEPLARRTILLQ